MSLQPSPIPPVPGVTACVAHAAFPHGNVVMQLRDALGSIYTDEVFADLFPTHGQPAEAPWRLALVTVFQFMECLTDRQAADAVRDRLAWKYALSLELTDPGFDHTVLSEFRSRLVEGHAEQRLLDLLLERCRPRVAQPGHSEGPKSTGIDLFLPESNVLHALTWMQNCAAGQTRSHSAESWSRLQCMTSLSS